MRRWPELAQAGPVSRTVAAEVEALTMRERAKDKVLRWIDVEAYPDEPEGAWSTDFSGGAPRAALQAWHDAYGEMMADRYDAAVSTETVSGLGNLGYADGGSAGPVSSDRFSLPPPGQELLRKP